MSKSANLQRSKKSLKKEFFNILPISSLLKFGEGNKRKKLAWLMLELKKESSQKWKSFHVQSSPKTVPKLPESRVQADYPAILQIQTLSIKWLYLTIPAVVDATNFIISAKAFFRKKQLNKECVQSKVKPLLQLRFFQLFMK